MCQHRYLIERQPSADDYDAWQDIEEIPMDGGVHLDPAERERGLTHARQIASDYALAYPDRAAELVITRYRCCGPEESERPYEHRPAPTPDPNDTPVIKQLTTLSLRFRSDGDEQADDEILGALDSVWRLALDARRLAGENARLRCALRSYADPDAWRPQVGQHAPGKLTVELPISADAGRAAQSALRGEPAAHLTEKAS